MGQGALNYQGVKSGIKLNDIIEEFKYVYKGQELKAGDLVKYINGISSTNTYGSITTELSSVNSSKPSLSAITLSDNKVFIAFAGSSTTYTLYVCICTIDKTTIVKGTSVSLGAYRGNNLSLVALDEDRVFVTFTHTDSHTVLYGNVCTISGTTIAKGTDTKLISTTYGGDVMSSVLLNSGKIFVARSFVYTSSNFYLYGNVCTISGTTITPSTDVAISTTSHSGHAISAVLLPSGNVFIAHSSSSSRYLYGTVCSVSGTTITKGTNTALVSSNYAGSYITACLTEEGNVFIAHSYSNTYYLYSIICSVSGTTITKGTDTSIVTADNNTSICSIARLVDGGIVIIFAYSDSYYMYGIGCITRGTTTYKYGGMRPIDNTNTYSGYKTSIAPLPNGSFFLLYRQNSQYKLYGKIMGMEKTMYLPVAQATITEYEQQVTQAIENSFDAVALSSGMGSLEYVELTKLNNIFKRSTWNKIKDWVYYGDSGIRITMLSDISALSSSQTPELAFDEDESTIFVAPSASYASLLVELPEPVKITQMKLKAYITSPTGSDLLGDITVLGSIDGQTWETLHISTKKYTSLTEITLDNVDFYSQYMLKIRSTDTQYNICVSDWQVSKYVQLVPSTGHNEQVKIAKHIPKEISVVNVFPFGDFEEALSDWRKYGLEDASISLNTNSLEGSKCLRFYVGDANITTTFTAYIEHYFSTKKNHKYYFRCFYKKSSASSATFLPTLATINGKGGSWMTNTTKATKNTTSWVKYSKIGTADRTADDARLRIIISETTSGVTTLGGSYIYFDSLVGYDLTEMYGDGREPSIEWCDANL